MTGSTNAPSGAQVGATRMALVVVEDAGGERSLATPVPPTAENWDAWLAGQRTDNTTRAYASDWAQFQAWCAERGVGHVRQVSYDLLVAYGNWLHNEPHPPKGKPYANTSIARKLAAIRQALDYAVARGVLLHNPAKVLKGYVVPTTSPRVMLSKPQVRALLAAPDTDTLLGLRDRAMLAVLCYLGLRRFELAGLTRGSLGTEGAHTFLRILGKGGDVERLPVPPAVLDYLNAYLALADRQAAALGLPLGPEAPLFRPTSNNGNGGALDGHLDPVTGLRRVQRAAKLAGVSVAHLDAHTLLVTAISTALEAGASLTDAQRMARHKDIRTTTRYDKRLHELGDSAVYRVNY